MDNLRSSLKKLFWANWTKREIGCYFLGFGSALIVMLVLYYVALYFNHDFFVYIVYSIILGIIFIVYGLHSIYGKKQHRR